MSRYIARKIEIQLGTQEHDQANRYIYIARQIVYIWLVDRQEDRNMVRYIAHDQAYRQIDAQLDRKIDGWGFKKVVEIIKIVIDNPRLIIKIMNEYKKGK